MSLVERLPPGHVLAHVPFDDCLLARPRRRMPADIALWASALPVPSRLATLGLAGPLRETVAPLWLAVLARFRQGLRIEAGEQARVVVHCDTVRYEFTPFGGVHARMPRVGGGYEAIAVEVGTPFPSWNWVRLLALHEAEAVAPLMHTIHVRRLAGLVPANFVPGGVERQALMWLCRVIEGLARRCVDGLKMRAYLRQALDLDPLLLTAARRSRPRAYAGDVGNDWWNRCVEHKELLLEVQGKAPGLLPVVGELVWAGKLTQPPRDVLALRRLINDQLLPADWKRVSSESARPLWAMWRQGLICSLESVQSFMVCWARLHRGLPQGMRMPLAMFEPLARTWVGPLANHVLPPVRWPGTPAATRQAIEAYLKARDQGEGARFIETQWGPVVRWAADYTDTGRSDVRHWSTCKRLAAEDERKIRAGLAGQQWPCPLPRFERREYLAIALCTGADLAEEAIAMHHCADRFAPKCAGGGMQVYGIRDATTGRRLATAAFEIHGDDARLVELARSLNRRADPDEEAFAGQLAKALSNRMKSEAEAKRHRELPIPPPEAKAIYMERKDSDVFAFVEGTPTGWQGYKVLPNGTIRQISGIEAVETLNPNSWAPMARVDFISSVNALRAMRGR